MESSGNDESDYESWSTLSRKTSNESDFDFDDDEVFDDWMEDVNDSPIDALPDQGAVKELLKKCRGLVCRHLSSSFVVTFRCPSTV